MGGRAPLGALWVPRDPPSGVGALPQHPWDPPVGSVLSHGIPRTALLRRFVNYRHRRRPFRCIRTSQRRVSLLARGTSHISLFSPQNTPREVFTRTQEGAGRCLGMKEPAHFREDLSSFFFLPFHRGFFHPHHPPLPRRQAGISQPRPGSNALRIRIPGTGKEPGREHVRSGKATYAPRGCRCGLDTQRA